VSAEAIARVLAESLGVILIMLSFIETVARRRLLRIGRTAAEALGLVGCVAFLVANLLPPDWPFEALWLALTVSRIFIFWWRRRKSRRRARALWGQKGLARLRSMLGALRERAKPRPVLKPQRTPA
jgi:O-antigen/teichoic acid export membrane protein